MRRSSIRVRSAASLALFGALQACAGGEDGAGPQAGMAGGGAGPSYAATVQPLFDSSCSCHLNTDSPIPLAPFSLKPEVAYGNLVNAPSTQQTTMPLVKPGVLNSSYLWHKVNDTQLQVGGMGQRMPSTIPFNADELAIVERWIAGGALP